MDFVLLKNVRGVKHIALPCVVVVFCLHASEREISSLTVDSFDFTGFLTAYASNRFKTELTSLDKELRI